MTTIDDVQGTWTLTGHHSITTTFDLSDNDDTLVQELDAASTEWLEKVPGTDVEFAAADGLELTISPDGRLTETGSTSEEVFDVDGVLDQGAAAFDGEVRPQGDLLVVMADDGDGDGKYLRCDDGDTQVSDSLQIVGDDLIRTQSVVTDGMYPSRVWLRYARA